jgi:hypothetical protein
MSSLLIMTLRVINKVLVQLQSLMPKIRTRARQVEAFTTLFFRRMEVQSLSFLRWIGLSKEPATGMSVDLELTYRYEDTEIFGSRKIRLLRIMSRKVFTSNIECQLSVISLDDTRRSQFQAISYTWGRGDRTHTITVNDRQFYLTKNAFEVLQDCRSWMKDVVI